MLGQVSETDGVASALKTAAPAPDEQRKAALVLCDRAGLSLAPDQWLDPDADPKDIPGRPEILEFAAFLLGAIDAVDYDRVPHKHSPQHRPVMHGTRSAVAAHAALGELWCGPCERWVAVHNRRASTCTPVAVGCGTAKACQAHHRAGEALCVICQDWSDERHAASRLAPGARCGTATGAQMHRNLGEAICDPCRLAENADRRHGTAGSRTGRRPNHLKGA